MSWDTLVISWVFSRSDFIFSSTACWMPCCTEFRLAAWRFSSGSAPRLRVMGWEKSPLARFSPPCCSFRRASTCHMAAPRIRICSARYTASSASLRSYASISSSAAIRATSTAAVFQVRGRLSTSTRRCRQAQTAPRLSSRSSRSTTRSASTMPALHRAVNARMNRYARATNTTSPRTDEG